MIELVLEDIYILSTVICIVGFLFVVYHGKKYSKCIKMSLAMLSGIQVSWFFSQSEIMDSFYDIAFIYIVYILIAKVGTSVYTKGCPKSCELFMERNDGKI